MADAYSRVTGKTGVVLVTSGPGATNTVTPIATAYMDSIPMVILSGQVASHLIGEDAFRKQTWWEFPVQSSNTVSKSVMQVKFLQLLKSILYRFIGSSWSGRG